MVPGPLPQIAIDSPRVVVSESNSAPIVDIIGCETVRRKWNSFSSENRKFSRKGTPMMKRHLDPARDHPKRFRRGSVDRPAKPFRNLENRRCFYLPALVRLLPLQRIFRSAFCLRFTLLVFASGPKGLVPTQPKALPGTASIHGV